MSSVSLPLRRQTVLDHILDAHWKELHFHSEMNKDRILEMLGGYNMEVLYIYQNVKTFSSVIDFLLHIRFVSFVPTWASTIGFWDFEI